MSQPPIASQESTTNSLLDGLDAATLAEAKKTELTNEQLDQLANETVQGIEQLPLAAAEAKKAASGEKVAGGGTGDGDVEMGERVVLDEEGVEQVDPGEPVADDPDAAKAAAAAAAVAASAKVAADDKVVDPHGDNTTMLVAQPSDTGLGGDRVAQEEEQETEDDDDDDDDQKTEGGRRGGGKEKEPTALPKVTPKARELFEKHVELFEENGIKSVASLDRGVEEKISVKVVQSYIKEFNRGSSKEDDEDEEDDVSKYGLAESQDQQLEEEYAESAESVLRKELRENSSLVIGRKVKDFKKKLTAAKDKLSSDSLSWQHPIKEYVRDEEPGETEGNEIKKLTSVLKYASEDINRKVFRQMLSRAVTEMMEVHDTAADSIDELQMKIRVGKDVFQDKALQELAQKAAALDSDEDEPPKKALKVSRAKPSPTKKTKK